MKFNRIMPGKQSMYLQQCIDGKFIGVDFGFTDDLSNYINDDFKSFASRYRPIYLKN